MTRLALVALVLLPILAAVTLDLDRHLSLDAFHASQEIFDAWYERQPLLVTGGYVALFVVASLLLPVAAPLIVIAGALFGLWVGVLVASLAIGLTAVLAFLLSRYLLHDLVQRHFGERLATVNAGMAKDGAFYLFSLRLVTFIPFAIVNLVMGLTPISTLTFWWVTQVGMLGVVLIYVNAGTQLAEVDSLADVFSPGLIGSLALLGLFPILARKALALIRRRLG